MFCPKCGTEYKEDARYCERCGKSLQKSIHERNVLSKDLAESDGRSNGIKVLVVICIILIAGVGVTVGTLLQKTANTQAPTSGPNQPTWHQVAVYNGPGAVNSTFSTRGNQFKVTMSAVPLITYKDNYLNVTVGSGNNMVALNALNWNATESPTKKEKDISLSRGSGTYDIVINPVDIQNYTVTVWDYY